MGNETTGEVNTSHMLGFHYSVETVVGSIRGSKGTRVNGAGAVGSRVGVRGLWFLEYVAFGASLQCEPDTRHGSRGMRTSLWQTQSQ